jgi:hypothetical protein
MTTSQDSSAAGAPAPAPQVSCFRADRIALVSAAVLTVLSATVGRMQGWWRDQEPGEYVFVAGLLWALVVALRGLWCAWTRRRAGHKETKP